MKYSGIKYNIQENKKKIINKQNIINNNQTLL